MQNSAYRRTASSGIAIAAALTNAAVPQNAMNPKTTNPPTRVAPVNTYTRPVNCITNSVPVSVGNAEKTSVRPLHTLPATSRPKTW